MTSNYGKAGAKNGVQAVQGMGQKSAVLIGSNTKPGVMKQGISAKDTLKMPKSKITPTSKKKKVVVDALLKMMKKGAPQYRSGAGSTGTGMAD